MWQCFKSKRQYTVELHLGLKNQILVEGKEVELSRVVTQIVFGIILIDLSVMGQTLAHSIAENQQADKARYCLEICFIIVVSFRTFVPTYVMYVSDIQYSMKICLLRVYATDGCSHNLLQLDNSKIKARVIFKIPLFIPRTLK